MVPYLEESGDGGVPPPDLADCRTVVYTPEVATTPRRIADGVQRLRTGLEWVVDAALHPELPYDYTRVRPDRLELLIVDEVDRLKLAGLEQLRDTDDRGQLGLVLIGMPGLEKRLARYAQRYSRVGFVHQYRALGAEELRFILERKWAQLGLAFSPDDFTDAEALAAIARITGGNFRLVQRLFAQIERVLEINQLRTITAEVVQVARESLVIGPLG